MSRRKVRKKERRETDWWKKDKESRDEKEWELYFRQKKRQWMKEQNLWIERFKFLRL